MPLAPEGASGIVAGAHSTFSRASAITPRGVRRARAEGSASMERWNVGILIFYVVETLFGRAVADETAHYIEYRRVAA